MNTAQSSHLQNYEYQADSQTLTVTFLNGAVYQYAGVSFDDFNRLMQSGGSGTTFWSAIRNRYRANKIASGVSMAGKGALRREARNTPGTTGVRPVPATGDANLSQPAPVRGGAADGDT